MQQILVLTAISILTRFLTPELFKKGLAFVKEKAESLVDGTDTQLDDVLYAALKGERDKLVVIVDAGLEFIENYVLGTASSIDDALVLPAVDNLRLALEIND